MRSLAFPILLAAACSAACADTAGGGASDTGMGGPDPFDAGPGRDARPARDAEVRPDAGNLDPATIFQGVDQIGGVRIYIHIRGTLTSTMPPVVFLNTGPSIGNEYLVEPMDFLLGPGGAESPDRLLVFFDLRSTGRSGFGTLGSTTTVSVFSHIVDLTNVIDHVETMVDASRVDLVGHGYGAGIAALFAAHNPERVSRLVLTAPHPANVMQHALYHAEISARLSSADRERFLQITRDPECRGNIQQCSIELWNLTGPLFLCEDNRHLFEAMTFEYSDLRAGFIYIDFELRESAYDWARQLARITTDTTIISGPCDPIPADAAATYAAEISGSTHHIIPNTGHFPMVEARDTYRGIVRRALTYP